MLDWISGQETDLLQYICLNPLNSTGISKTNVISIWSVGIFKVEVAISFSHVQPHKESDLSLTDCLVILVSPASTRGCINNCGTLSCLWRILAVSSDILIYIYIGYGTSGGMVILRTVRSRRGWRSCLNVMPYHMPEVSIQLKCDVRVPLFFGVTLVLSCCVLRCRRLCVWWGGYSQKQASLRWLLASCNCSSERAKQEEQRLRKTVFQLNGYPRNVV